MANDDPRTARLATFLRVYGVLSLVIFGTLSVGFAIQAPQFAEGGSLNWMIWNDLRCGDQPCHVPPMIFALYLVWGVYFFRAARNPRAYASFLDFTMWANLLHGVVMGAQTFTMMDRYWPKWFSDVPYTLILAAGIYLLRPTASPGDAMSTQPAR